MPTIQTRPGETLSTLADRIFNGDVTRFGELLDLNPDLDVFGELPQELSLQIPDTAQILNYAKPALTRVSQAIGGVSQSLNQVQGIVQQVAGVLPDELQGYPAEALAAIGTINGIAGQVEQALNNPEEGLRRYSDQLVSLVPWLLNGR